MSTSLMLMSLAIPFDTTGPDRAIDRGLATRIAELVLHGRTTIVARILFAGLAVTHVTGA